MATPTNSGYKSEILNVSITGASWTPVVFSSIPNNVLIVSRGQNDMYVSLDSLGTTYVTIPAGQSLTYDWNMGKADSPIYLKGSTTDVAEVVATFEG